MTSSSQPGKTTLRAKLLVSKSKDGRLKSALPAVGVENTHELHSQDTKLKVALPGQPTKILFVVTQGNFGGAQKYVYDLAKNLHSNFSVIAAAGGSDTQLKEKLSEIPVKFFPLKHLTRAVNPLRDLLAVWEIGRLIKKEGPDIVHLNSSKAGVVGSFAAKIWGRQSAGRLEEENWIQGGFDGPFA